MGNRETRCNKRGRTMTEIKCRLYNYNNNYNTTYLKCGSTNHHCILHKCTDAYCFCPKYTKLQIIGVEL